MTVFLSVFIFSVLLFSSSLLFFPFLHSLSLDISATFHKNHVFVLCNGILVFIFRNSGISCSSPASFDHGGEISEIREKRETELPPETREAEEKSRDIHVDEKEREGKNEDEDDKKEPEMAEEEDEEMLGAEELNRKCDDFIRRVKEEMRFESEPAFIDYHSQLERNTNYHSYSLQRLKKIADL